MSDSLRPHGLYNPWSSPGQNTAVGSLSLLQEIFPTQGSNPGLLHCRWILHCWATGKPKNTGVGSLTLLQWIFLTQESNQDLLHGRWILYQLSYEGSRKLLTNILHASENTHAMLSHFSRVRLCVTPWTAAHQASPSLGFSRQEHWSGLPFPSPAIANGYF